VTNKNPKNMDLTGQIAKHLREVYFGGNWTTSNLKANLADVTWQQATRQVYTFNTIATLVFHVNYYVSAALKVLHGNHSMPVINIVLTIRPSYRGKTGKNSWTPSGPMPKTLPA
jgi:hypothetical protein